MKKIKKYLKNKFKLFIVFMIGIIISGIGVYATTSYFYNSNEVSFDNTNSNLTLNGNNNNVTNIKDAVDALYDKITSGFGCQSGYVKGSDGTRSYICESTSLPVTVNDIVTKATQIGLENVADAYRYVGSNPDNYISFNEGELWRIIGVYTISNVNYLKIVKATPLSSTQQYNSSTSTNAWNSSTLKTYLNKETSGGYYYTLSSDAKNMIYDGGIWNVGASPYNVNAETAYTRAQGTTTTQKVGLIASYEYQYAATSDCWTTNGNSYGTNCGEKDWLWKTLTNEKKSYPWLMNPYSGSTSNVLYLGITSGNLSSYGVTNRIYASPVVYLKTGVTINGGMGFSDNPYTLICSTC